jgi:xylose isomerase
MNFDAKIRRQSIEPEDLIHAHIGGVDLCARAFLTAARLFEEGRLEKAVAARYANWETPLGRAMLSGELSLEEIAARAESEELNATPRSGRQERLENLVSRYF